MFYNIFNFSSVEWLVFCLKGQDQIVSEVIPVPLISPNLTDILFYIVGLIHPSEMSPDIDLPKPHNQNQKITIYPAPPFKEDRELKAERYDKIIQIICNDDF